MTSRPMEKITYAAKTREAEIALRQRLIARGFTVGRTGCDVYFWAHTTYGFTRADSLALCARLEGVAQ